ncbi:MAG: tetratricopeptide repeat protein [Planctomycetes bacterium]|nr:tetratricopeptide repeat protein [Planctomycetota bacterium]
MGLFDSVRRRRELEKLERDAAENPSPLTLSTLAERCIAFGETEHALEVVRRAVETFPDNDRVLTTYRYIMKSHLQSRILELQRAIDKAPTPAGFTRLAELHYKELGDRDAALEMCRRGIALYPGDESLAMIYGQIRIDRFHEDFQAKDGLQAIEHLARAARINPQNYKALLLLAKVYGEAGAYAHAQEALEQIMRFSPQDDRARGIFDRLAGVAKGSTGSEDVDMMLREVERRGGLDDAGKALMALFDTENGSRQGGGEPAADVERISRLIRMFSELDGLLAAVVLSTDGRTVAVQGRADLPMDPIAQVAHTVFTTSEEASKRMDIGSFQRAVIEGPFGRMTLVQMKHHLTLGVLTNQAVKPDATQSAIERFLDVLAKSAPVPEKG